MVYAVKARSLSSLKKLGGGAVSGSGTICREHLTLNTEEKSRNRGLKYLILFELLGTHQAYRLDSSICEENVE